MLVAYFDFPYLNLISSFFFIQIILVDLNPISSFRFTYVRI